MRLNSVVTGAWRIAFACGSACAGEGTQTLDESSGPGSGSTSSTTTVSSGSSTTAMSATTSSEGDSGTTGSQNVFDVGDRLRDLAAGDSTETGTIIDWDCGDLVQPFESELVIPNATGHHDVYFDDEGHILGWDGSSILASTYDGELSVFLPGVISAQGMDVLDNGDLLYVNDFGELRRVTPDQQSSVVASGLNGAYGITVGPDQVAYVCTWSGIMRVDPESGDATPWVSVASVTPRAMVFNLDSTGAYFSTLLQPGATIYFVELDENLDPTADPVIFADGVGGGHHDGLGIDACGNLYAPDYETSGLYRVDPEGTVTVVYEGGGSGQPHYGHGLEWGSGIDGWNDKALYLPQPFNDLTVNEVVLGVPSGDVVRTWRRAT